jgi:hypothetical protein
MKKVYFEVESKSWVLDDLDEIYSFKYIDIMTNEERNGILTWLKRNDHSEIGIGEEDRLYGVELFDEEYLFVETYKEGKFYLYAKDNMHLERLCRDHNVVFVGEKRKAE